MEMKKVISLILTIIYVIIDIFYMKSTTHKSFWINSFRGSLFECIFILILIFAIIYFMIVKTGLINIIISIPLTIITYIGGFRGIPLFSLNGIIYAWLTFLIFSFLVTIALKIMTGGGGL